MSEEVDFSRSHWAGISDEAKDFIKLLLNKDPAQRPTAREALKHPWLKGAIEERTKGRPLSLAVVQRIQRFSQASLFKRTVLEMIAEELLTERPDEEDAGDAANAQGPACALGTNARPLIDDPSASPLEYLYERLRLVDHALVDRSELAQGLTEMGYKLAPDEVDRLLDQLDPGNTGQVGKTQLAASQMDWRAVQENQTERWLRCARRAFADLDSDKDGLVSTDDMMALLRHKLPPSEVEAAVKQALVEAARRRETDGSSHGGSKGSAGNSTHGGSEAGGSMHGNGSAGDPSLRNGLNFRQFIRMLNAGSCDSLDLYDDRVGSLGSLASMDRPGSFSSLVGSPSGNYDRVNVLLERSVRGGDVYARPAHLDTVVEENTGEASESVAMPK